MAILGRDERTGVALAVGAVLLVGGSVAASRMVAGYPVLGGQGARYLVAGMLLAGWARLRGKSLVRPRGHEWAWLGGLAVVGQAGCSVLLIAATRVTDPAGVGVVIGAAPLVIVVASSLAARRRPSGRILTAAVVVAAGVTAAQLAAAGGGPAWTPQGLLLSLGALAGVVGTTLFAAPLLPRLGALAATTYASSLAGVTLLAAATLVGATHGEAVLRVPTPTELLALAYLAVAVTAVVFIAWYGAMERLGAQRTGLFNGLIPLTSLLAVAVTGTGTVTAVLVLGAAGILAGVVLGLTRGAGTAARSPSVARRLDG
ncbi:DMT family transporter [Dactylosporangium sp. NPDC048998]|uniref:DMT family transporter n=1 Tax=Dactylosporangium sp. NPDC048998 TaxID=3363976 RepID=UPI003710F4FE